MRRDRKECARSVDLREQLVDAPFGVGERPVDPVGCASRFSATSSFGRTAPKALTQPAGGERIDMCQSGMASRDRWA
jgi:hypothetical protein